MDKRIRLFEAYGNETSPVESKYESDYVHELVEQVNDLIEWVKQGNSPETDDIIYLIGVTKSYYKLLTNQNLFDNVADLLWKKTQDYNSDKINDPDFRLDDARTHYFPFGDQSYLHMILTKVQRIESLYNSKQANNFEGKNDSLIDVAAYLSFYFSYKLDRLKALKLNDAELGDLFAGTFN